MILDKKIINYKVIHPMGNYLRFRGVRQGSPLSPLLFVFWQQILLQTLLNDSKQNGLLQLPIPLPGDPDFPILQYADDTLVFLQADLP